jgi:hypothetical protein
MLAPHNKPPDMISEAAASSPQPSLGSATNSAKTARRRWCARSSPLGSILADAQERGLVRQNVVHALRKRRTRGKARSADRRQKGKLKVGVDIPTPDEIKTLIPKLEGRWKPLLLTAIFTGLHASELRGLRWTDIDLARNELHVRQRADRFHTIGALKSVTSQRSIPLLPMVTNALRIGRAGARGVGADAPDTIQPGLAAWKSRRKIRADNVVPLRVRPPSRLDVTPSLLLQFHNMDDAGGNDGRFGHDCNRVAFFLLHSLLGVVAGGELDLAWKRIFLNPLDAILHRRGVGAQHVQSRAVGDDVDVDVLVLRAVILDHVGGVVQRQIHQFWIVLIDLNDDAMRLAFARIGSRGKGN